MVSKKRKLRPWLIRIYNNGSSTEYIIMARSRDEAREQARLMLKSFPLARGFDVRQIRKPLPGVRV